jgi:hypothetical protein
MLGLCQAAEKETDPIGMSSSTGTVSTGAALGGIVGVNGTSRPTPPVEPAHAARSVVEAGSIG